MDTVAASPPATPGPRAVAPGGYRKGEEARQRILDAALRAFGAGGFKAATTRRIAEEAGVNLPALKYYFGGKAGLYLACAEEIVGRYEQRMLAVASGVQAALQADLTPPQARALLKEILGALAEVLVGTDGSEVWTAFFLREMADRGPAFDILYGQLWAPGVDLTADLISRAMGEGETSRAARIQALLMLSSLSAFSVARPVALKYLDWPDAKGERLALIRTTLADQIDRIGHQSPAPGPDPDGRPRP